MALAAPWGTLEQIPPGLHLAVRGLLLAAAVGLAVEPVVWALAAVAAVSALQAMSNPMVPGGHDRARSIVVSRRQDLFGTVVIESSW